MKDKALRYGLFWSSTVFLLFIPILIIAIEYDLFLLETYNLFKLTLVGAILIVIVIFFFRRHFDKWVDSLPASMGKSVIGFTRTILPFIVLWYFAYYAAYHTEIILRVVTFIFLSAFIGALLKEGHIAYLEKVVETQRFKRYGK